MLPTREAVWKALRAAIFCEGLVQDVYLGFTPESMGLMHPAPRGRLEPSGQSFAMAGVEVIISGGKKVRGIKFNGLHCAAAKRKEVERDRSKNVRTKKISDTSTF